MPDIFEEALGRLSGGLALDLAIGEGGFVELLVQYLGCYAGIVGADADGSAVEVAGQRFDRGEIAFVQMEGERLGFVEGSFDTVTISASLHHLADIPPVLAEVERVLRPGGHLVLAEMHRDGQTAAQRTVIALHHWIADVASALGMVHNRTMSRQDLVNHAQSLGLCDVVCYDTVFPEEDPMEETVIQELEGAVDQTLQQVGEAPSQERLKRRGESLRERLGRVGAQWEPVVVIVGRKG
jgi:2-polyprenyl-3-methyl-5-hydroxy-6-metoxy-1,4-benzoquinol methylase